MPMTLEQTTGEALSLAEMERARLAHLLIASLESTADDFSVEWTEEVGRRVKEIDNGTAQGRPAADVIREVRAHYE